jgi:hypothetical protein
VVASILGIAFSYTGYTLPVPIERTVAGIGQMALPLALLSIGASLTFSSLSGSNLRRSITAALFKSGLAPLAGVLIGGWFGLKGPALMAPLLYLACPTAVMSYVMAKQMNGDGELACGIVVISVFTSLISFSVILATFV